MKPKKVAPNVLPIVLTAVILVALLSFIDLHALLAAFRKADLRYFLAAVVIAAIFSVLLFADRWRRIVNALGYNLSYRDALHIYLAGRPISFVLPLKSGEMAAAYYLKKRKGFSFRKVVSSVLLDKYLLLISTLQLCVIGAIFIFWSNPGIASALFVGLILSLALVAPLRLPGIRPLLSFVGGRFSRVTEHVGDFMSAFTSISIGQIFFFLGYCHLAQIAHIVIFYLLFLVVRVQASIPLGALVLYVSLIVLLTNVPITISGLGTREAFVLYFFSGYAQPEALVAVGILVSFVEYVLPALYGMAFQRDFIRKLLF